MPVYTLHGPVDGLWEIHDSSRVVYRGPCDTARAILNTLQKEAAAKPADVNGENR